MPSHAALPRLRHLERVRVLRISSRRGSRRSGCMDSPTKGSLASMECSIDDVQSYAGLMDAGVGSIVVASAIASGMHAAHVAPPSSNGRASREAARLAVLVMLGAGKAAFAAASDYQVHVGEYGVHWNFFLTLAALRILKLAVPRSICRSALQSGETWMNAAHADFMPLSWLIPQVCLPCSCLGHCSACKSSVPPIQRQVHWLHPCGAAGQRLFEREQRRCAVIARLLCNAAAGQQLRVLATAPAPGKQGHASACV